MKTASKPRPVVFPKQPLEQLRVEFGGPSPWALLPTRRPKDWEARLSKLLTLQRRAISPALPLQAPPARQAYVPPPPPPARRIKPKKASAEEIEARQLPESYACDLLSDEMRTALIQVATRESDAELVILVDLRPSRDLSRQWRKTIDSLQHDQDNYDRHLGKLVEVVGDSIRSLQYPEDPTCRFSAEVVRLQETWLESVDGGAELPGPALFDWKRQQVKQQLHQPQQRATSEILTCAKPPPPTTEQDDGLHPSNLHRVGATASRLGAFEVYVVFRPRPDHELVPSRAQGSRAHAPSAAAESGAASSHDRSASDSPPAEPPKPARVEQAFSKLFSRCWPRADCVVRRLRSSVTLDLEMEMGLRERRHVLREARQLPEKEAIRAVLDEQRAAADAEWPRIEATVEAQYLIGLLREWDALDALRGALHGIDVDGDGVTDGIDLDGDGKVDLDCSKPSELIDHLEAVAQRHLKYCADQKLTMEVHEHLRGRSDRALTAVVQHGTKAEYDLMPSHRLAVCSDDVAKLVRTKLDTVAEHDCQLQKALSSGEASALVEALRGVDARWNAALVEASHAHLKKLLAGDLTLKRAISSGRKGVVIDAIAQHAEGEAASRSQVAAAKEAVKDISDAVLTEALKTGNKAALDKAAIGAERHLLSCRPEVAEMVRRSQKDGEGSETTLRRAMASGEAASIISALKIIDQRLIPDVVAAAHAQLRPLLTSDAALRKAISSQTALFEPSVRELLGTCSASLKREAKAKTLVLADEAMRSVLATGDGAALTASAQTYGPHVSTGIAHAARYVMQVVATLETVLKRALDGTDPPTMAHALQHVEQGSWQLEQLLGSPPAPPRDAATKWCPRLVSECLAKLEAAHEAARYAREEEVKRRSLEALEAALLTREALSVQQAIEACEHSWNPSLLTRADAVLLAIQQADAAIAEASVPPASSQSRMSGTAAAKASRNIVQVQRMEAALEACGERASPSLRQQAIDEVEAIKRESKLVSMGIKFAAKLKTMPGRRSSSAGALVQTESRKAKGSVVTEATSTRWGEAESDHDRDRYNEKGEDRVTGENRVTL